jgi:hypothetical protein
VTIAALAALVGCQSTTRESRECYRLTYETGRVHEVCKQGRRFDVRDVEGTRRPNAEGALKRSLDTIRNIEHGIPID